jgi:hypothetical protein
MQIGKPAAQGCLRRRLGRHRLFSWPQNRRAARSRLSNKLGKNLSCSNPAVLAGGGQALSVPKGKEDSIERSEQVSYIRSYVGQNLCPDLHIQNSTRREFTSRTASHSLDYLAFSELQGIPFDFNAIRILYPSHGKDSCMQEYGKVHEKALIADVVQVILDVLVYQLRSPGTNLPKPRYPGKHL